MANQCVKNFITSAKLIAPLLIVSGFLIQNSGYAVQKVTSDTSLKDVRLALNVAENYYGLPSYDLISSVPVAPKTPSSSFLRELTLAQRSSFEQNTGNAPVDDTQEDPNLVPLANSRQKLLLEGENIAAATNANTDDDIDAIDANGQKIQLLPLEDEPAAQADIPQTTDNALPPIPASNARLVNPESQIILPPPPRPQEAAKTPFVVASEPSPVPVPAIVAAPAAPAPAIASAPVAPALVITPSPKPVAQVAPVAQEKGAKVIAPVTPAITNPAYTAKRGDTLGKISDLVPSSGLTSAQKLVALYNRNPSAFLDKNMNRLIVGSSINLDELNDYPSNAAARKEVASQYARYLGSFDTKKPVLDNVKIAKTPVETAPKTDIVNIPATVETIASTPIIETKILPPIQASNQSNIEVMPAEKSSGRSITIALIALILAALGGYVFLRIRSRNRIPLD